MRRRIFGILLCALILAGTVFAQAPGRMVRRRAAGTMRMLQQLNLTPEQRTQVRTLFQQQRQQVQAVRQDQSLASACAESGDALGAELALIDQR